MDSTTIATVDKYELHVGKTGKNACDGDSGGPLLLTENGVEMLIGTDDYSLSNTDCTGGDYYLRLDSQLAFVMQFFPVPTADAGAPLDAAADALDEPALDAQADGGSSV